MNERVGERSGRRVVLVMFVGVVTLVGFMGVLVAVFGPPTLRSVRLLGVVELPPTPAGLALYGAGTIATLLGGFLLAVSFVSRRLGNAKTPNIEHRHVSDMYNVLLAVDSDEHRAITQANAIADLPNAAEDVHVTILHSFTDNPSGASVGQVASVRRAEEILTEAGIDTDEYEESGNPVAAIMEVADEFDADVICVGGRKRSPAGKALFGSVAQDVILSADRPVLVTGGAAE